MVRLLPSTKPSDSDWLDASAICDVPAATAMAITLHFITFIRDCSFGFKLVLAFQRAPERGIFIFGIQAQLSPLFAQLVETSSKPWNVSPRITV